MLQYSQEQKLLPKEQKMNINEFAEIAGVSKTAVSRYFNDGYLSEEKRRIIEAAIEKTGYSPNASAHYKSRRITKLVGVIIPKLSSESCAAVTEGISRVLNEEGYQILLINTSNTPQKEVQALDLLRNNRVDGVIFLATVFTEQHETVLKKMQIPVIIIGQRHKGFSCVCHDDFGAAYALTELMLKKGRTKPACICADGEDKEAGLERLNGFKAAVNACGLEVNPKLITTSRFTIQSGYDAAQRIFSEEKLPDCLFCATDSMALGAMRYLTERGIKIPQEVMITGVGDSPLCDVAAVPLTSAHLHYRTAGANAADMLLSAVRRGETVPKTTKLDFEIVERAST